MKKEFLLHEESGLWVANDGEVFVPKSGKKPAHYTYGSNMNGYRVVKYKGKRYLVHRLVAEVYIPNYENKPYIDHIIPVSDGGTNDVSNLRWCTHKENCNNELTRQHISEALKGNQYFKGKHHTEETKQKMSESKKIPIIGTHKTTGEIVEFESAKDAWLTLNIAYQSINSCCRGRKKSAGGYKWRYA